MLDTGEDETNDRLYFAKKSEEEIKKEILDNSYKKASSKHNKKRIKRPKKKKPFLKIGFFVLLVGILCISIVKFVPWMYISYDPIGPKDSYDNSYYANFQSSNQSINGTVENFFSSGESSEYLGIGTTDFFTTSRIATYLCYLLIGLGIAFSIFVIIDKKIDVSFEKLIVYHTIYASLIIPILIYFIFILVKFIGAYFLIFNNSVFIDEVFPKLYILFPAPFLILFISAFLMEISFTIIKSNFSEVHKLNRDSKKIISSYNHKGGNI